MTDPNPKYTADEIATLLAVTRRALARLAVLEERMAVMERRQHDLDDIAETVEGIGKIARVGMVDDQRVRDLVNATMNKRLTKKGKAIGRDLGGEFE